MIKLHRDITLEEVRLMAGIIDAKLLQDGHGNITITPRRAIPAQGNGNVVKLPRRKRQFMHTRLPEPPEVA